MCMCTHMRGAESACALEVRSRGRLPSASSLSCESPFENCHSWKPTKGPLKRAPEWETEFFGQELTARKRGENVGFCQNPALVVTVIEGLKI